MGNHVFVSYSRSDETYVSALVAHLRSAGLTVWHDSGIDYGDQWVSVIQRNIDTCAAFVVVMSPTAEKSKWVLREVNRAEDRRKPILPLLLAGQPFFRLSELHYDDVRNGYLPDARFVGRLATLLNGAASSYAASSAVRFDGVYVSDPALNNGKQARQFARFTPDGIVYFIINAGDPSKVVSVLASLPDAKQGPYRIYGGVVDFTLQYDSGLHQFRGPVGTDGTELSLQWSTPDGRKGPFRPHRLWVTG